MEQSFCASYETKEPWASRQGAGNEFLAKLTSQLLAGGVGGREQGLNTRGRSLDPTTTLTSATPSRLEYRSRKPHTENIVKDFVLDRSHCAVVKALDITLSVY